MKRGTFDHLEMGFPMRYVASANSPPSRIYSLIKDVGWNFGKILKTQNLQFSLSFVDWPILRISEESFSDFSINGERKINAKNPPWMIPGHLSTMWTLLVSQVSPQTFSKNEKFLVYIHFIKIVHTFLLNSSPILRYGAIF